MPKPASTAIARVRCRVCGALREELGAHIYSMHDLTGVEYRTRYGRSAPLVSEARRNAIRKATKIQMRDVRRRLESQAKRRGLRDWDLAVRIVIGQSRSEIAKAVGRSKAAIWKQASSLGFHERACLYYLGEPFLFDYARWLKERTDLRARDLAAMIGVSKLAVEVSLRRSPGLKVGTALKYICWLDRLFAHGMKINYRLRADLYPCSKSSVLRTLVPHLPKIYRLLLRGLKGLQPFVLETPSASRKALQKYICDQTRTEVAQRTRTPIFQPFLPLGVALWYWIERIVPRLADRSDRLQWIACDLLAGRFGTQRAVVFEAVQSRCSLVSPTKMRDLSREVHEKESRRQELPDRQSAKHAGGRPPEWDRIIPRVQELRKMGLTVDQSIEKIITEDRKGPLAQEFKRNRFGIIERVRNAIAYRNTKARQAERT